MGGWVGGVCVWVGEDGGDEVWGCVELVLCGYDE